MVVAFARITTTKRDIIEEVYDNPKLKTLEDVSKRIKQTYPDYEYYQIVKWKD